MADLGQESDPRETRRNGVTISLAPVAFATDVDYVTKLVTIINDEYAKSEDGIYQPGHVRTTVTEIENLIRKGQLAVAHLDKTTDSAPAGDEGFSNTGSIANPPEPIGSVYVKKISDTTNSLGMLAVRSSHHRRGVGNDLVAFAEAYSRDVGFTVMQVELLFPIERDHVSKVRLQTWYQRLGYQLETVGNFADHYPEFALLVTEPVSFKIFKKPL